MSDSYIVSARKYRPSTFSSVVGQSSLTRTLKNAIESGRVAQAYLFCGPRGVGKTSCARIFAKTINCENRTPDGEACGICDSCRDFERGVSYNIIELDAASNNGVDQMRSLTEQVNVPPASGRYRVFIIDEVHMLSTGAFNAFLKTLEEPPSYAVFILATTEKNKVLPTILSRCQTYDFSRITERDIASQLRRVAEAEHIEAEDRALEVIARKADGAMRDALSIFDQVAASGGGQVTYRGAIDNLNVLDYETYFGFTDAFAAADVHSALLLYRQVRDGGFDARFFINGLAGHVRNMLVAQSQATLPLLDVGEEGAGRYMEAAAIFDPQWYYKALELLQSCDLSFREALDKQLLVELTLIRLCQLRAADPPAEPPRKEALASLRPSAPVAASASPTPAPQQKSPDTAAQAQPSGEHKPAPRIPRQAPPPVSRPPRRSMSPQGRSLHFSQAAAMSRETQESEADEEPHAASPAPAAEINPELMAKAWDDFIAANPDKKLLLTAMRQGIPRYTGNGIYELSVFNQAQLQEAETHIGRLAEFLRHATGAASLSLTVTEVKPKERVRPLSPAEMLAGMIRSNPAVGKLLELLDAEQI